MPEPINTESGSGATSAKWRVLLLNDDHTPMDFVVHLLQELFDMEHDVAVNLMLHIHHHGVGECGVYTEEEAKTKVAAALALAREHGHPLQCIMEQKRST